MKFATRIIIITGLSTLLLTSLYWLASWHLVEAAEDANRDTVLTYLASQPNTSTQELEHLEQLLNEPGASERMERTLVIGGVLLFSIGTMGLTLLLLWQQTRPVRALMEAVQAVDPATPHLEPLEREDEVGELSRCFAQLLHRIEGFIQREQDFTRFASHELRSPLMVMRSSLDLLQEVSSDHATMEHRALARIDQALKRMERLTDSFLWLSRETPNATCQVDSETFEQLLQQYVELIPEARESIQLRIEPPLNWMIHPFVLSVILENLLNNARLHGTGKVMVQAQGNQLTITNPLPQAETAAEHPAYSGFGYGLAIIEQLCDRARATFSHEQDQTQFTARLAFQISASAELPEECTTRA
jgi:Signal transduction histidine kinase